MGNADTKLHFRKAVIQLTTKTRVGSHGKTGANARTSVGGAFVV